MLETMEVQITTNRVLAEWDMSRVRGRVRNEECISENQALAMEREYKRYLTLAVKNPQKRLPMSKAVDPFWHAHILHTLDYCMMCDRINNGLYIHHEPFSSATDHTTVQDSYQHFKMLYEEEFGEVPPVEFWPVELNSDCADGDACESSCSQCR